jgi:hypothetical protein
VSGTALVASYSVSRYWNKGDIAIVRTQASPVCVIVTSMEAGKPLLQEQTAGKTLRADNSENSADLMQVQLNNSSLLPPSCMQLLFQKPSIIPQVVLWHHASAIPLPMPAKAAPGSADREAFARQAVDAHMPH